jgi:hypothetical protein
MPRRAKRFETDRLASISTKDGTMADDMKDREPIDLMQEFANLYAREEMLAFFDFNFALPDVAPVAGLCRISKPKSGRSKMQYLSLTFVVDTPDERSLVGVQQALDKLDSEGLRKAVPQVVEVVPVPSLGSAAENYVSQADILLEIAPGEFFVSEKLVPAIAGLTQMKVTEFVWWGSGAPAPPAASAPPPAKGSSLVNSLRQYLGKHLGDRK